MDSRIHVDLPIEGIEGFCRKWSITELSLFGSVLRDDFNTNSDIDVLVTFSPSATHGLFALAKMQKELEQIFHREIDLVSRRGIEQSENYIRRGNIVNSAKVIYAA